MPVKLHPYKNKLPQPEGSRWLYLMGGDGDAASKEFVAADFVDLAKDRHNFSSAWKGLDALKEAWLTGQPLENIFDKKRCHDAHKFTDKNGRHQKIFRLRESNVRVYFIYPPPPPLSMLLAIKISTKYKDRLSKSEKTELEKLVNLVIEHQEGKQNAEIAINSRQNIQRTI